MANENDPDSLAIARHYLEKRGIPEENLILLKTITGEVITWDDFLETMFNPLREKLFAAGWIEGSLGDGVDSEGRRVLVTLGGRMDFLVLCRMPLKLKNDKERLENTPNKPQQQQFLVNQASTDSELALLAASDTPTIGFVPNPLFGQLRPPSLTLQQVVKVARLDGPSVEAAKALVDRALEAEQNGLRGRAYLDLGGPHQRGDGWLQEAGEQIEAMHFSSTWNKEPPALDFTERFDAPAFYFGWWKYNITGPPRERDFEFPPGAIGWHLHSYSAAFIRRNNFRWTGPLVQRGLTATVGNVFEPYLELTHHPHAFVKGLASGMSVGEAAYFALPALSWMAIFVGDPLYQPFATDLAAQCEYLEKTEEPDALDQYVVIREMLRQENEHGVNEALAYGKRMFRRNPGLALGYAIAQLAQKQGRPEDAIDALKFASRLPPIFGPNEQGLAFQCNHLLWELGARKDAYQLMKALMDSPLPDAARKAYLPTAIRQASVIGNMVDLRAWTTQQGAFEAAEGSQ